MDKINIFILNQSDNLDNPIENIQKIINYSFIVADNNLENLTQDLKYCKSNVNIQTINLEDKINTNEMTKDGTKFDVDVNELSHIDNEHIIIESIQNEKKTEMNFNSKFYDCLIL